MPTAGRRTTFAAVLMLAAVLLLPACTLLRVEFGPGRRPLVEETVRGSGRNKVLLVELSGVMLPGRRSLISLPWSQPVDMNARLARVLAKARDDDDIKALLLKIDSPGGAVATADVLHHQIVEYKEETGVKVVAQIMAVGASGGYYAATAAERIAALPAAVTGSIGVIAVNFNLSGLMSKYGVKARTVKSGRLKDMWSPFRPSTPEEERKMQALVDEMFERFKNKVLESRPGLAADDRREAFSGAVFSAGRALELGLIDSIGYPEDAFDEAVKLAGLKEARLVTYLRSGDGSAAMYSEGAEPGPALSAAEVLAAGSTPHLMYLWLPGLD